MRPFISVLKMNKSTPAIITKGVTQGPAACISNYLWRHVGAVCVLSRCSFYCNMLKSPFVIQFNCLLKCHPCIKTPSATSIPSWWGVYLLLQIESRLFYFWIAIACVWDIFRWNSQTCLPICICLAWRTTSILTPCTCTELTEGDDSFHVSL